jgi:hypothetical protein
MQMESVVSLMVPNPADARTGCIGAVFGNTWSG